MGDKNLNWKGEKIGLTALHQWVNNRLNKPELCENCNKEKSYDLANKGVYNRDFKNWWYLCRRCHMQSDGRLDIFLSHKISLKKGNNIWKFKTKRYFGDNSPNHKLNLEQVREIRNKYKTGKYTQIKLGKEYNVSFQNIHLIVTHKKWKDDIN